MLKTICVFCASSSEVDRLYLKVAEELADICVDNGIHSLFGGGAAGLMGAFADRVVERNGKITGVIPHFMLDFEWAHSRVTDMVLVDDMRERKKRLIENADAIVALPGGIGTLEELMEVSTLKQLGRIDKPIVIVNTNGFYNTLMLFINELIDKKFMKAHNRNLWNVIESPMQLISVYSKMTIDKLTVN